MYFGRVEAIPLVVYRQSIKIACDVPTGSHRHVSCQHSTFREGLHVHVQLSWYTVYKWLTAQHPKHEGCLMWRPRIAGVDTGRLSARNEWSVVELVLSHGDVDGRCHCKVRCWRVDCNTNKRRRRRECSVGATPLTVVNARKDHTLSEPLHVMHGHCGLCLYGYETLSRWLQWYYKRWKFSGN